MVVYSTLKLTSNKLIGFGLSLLAVLLIPSAEYQRFLLPLFWLGIYLKSQIDFIQHYSTQLLIATGLLFVGCLIFWDGYYSIYVTPFPALISLETLNWDVAYLPIAVYRWIVGAAGSLFLLLLFSKVYRNNAFFTALNPIGAMTLGIYTTQFGLLELGLSKVINLSQVNLWLFSFVFAPAIALTVLAVCVVLVKILSKNKYLSLLFIGNQLSQSKN